MKLGLVGLARSGKDTVAEYITFFKGFDIDPRISFAHPIRQTMYEFQDKLGLPRHKDRKLMQLLGDWGRSVDSDIFIKYVLRFASTNENVIVTDVRYMNEAEKLRENGFTLVKILGNPQSVDRSESEFNHSSEREVKHIICDYTIENNGTLDELYAKLAIAPFLN